MSKKTESDASGALMEKLEQSGFFKQIGELEGNLKAIAGDLQALGETATQRTAETESLAAHVLALEAILTVMARANPVDAAAVKAVIDENTVALTGSADQAEPVQRVADTILETAGD